jgi:tetratricopeptide (TPR) repeat protein
MVSWSRLASGFWSPDTVEEFKNRIDRTIEIAQTRVDKKVADSYDFFYLGGALGFKGRFELMKGEWLSSFLLASDAIEALKTCLRMDPNNTDVLLGIGTFDYYTARLSGVLKFLTYLLLHKGDKKEGLRKLNIAANEAIYSATETKSVLLHIYLFIEQDFENALILSSELAKKYPGSRRFKFLEGVSCIRLKMYPEYKETVDELRQRGAEASNRETTGMRERQALYLESTYALFQGRYSEARSILKRILDHPDPVNDPSMIAWPLIKTGMSYDLEKNREKAITYYNDVLNMENGSGAQFLAKKLLEGPLEKEDPFIGY